MKLSLTWPMLAAAALLAGGINQVRGDLEVSASVHIHAAADFDAPLAPIGAWVTVGGHGRCWHPTGVAVDWRPYCAGQWEWTDAGWYWTSDEPWAWACYHYGNWFDDPAVGWVWVPGVEWGPAWVTWRVSDAHIGWAPLPPSGIVVAPAMFAFVDIGHFHDRLSPGKLIVRNDAVFRETKETHRPDVATIQKHGEKIQRYAVRDIDRKTHYPEAVTRKAAERAEPKRAVEKEEPKRAVERDERPAPQERQVPNPVEPQRPIVEPPHEVPTPSQAPIPEPRSGPSPGPRGERDKGP